MINNTNLYNLSNYDEQFEKFLKDVESCKELCFTLVLLTKNDEEYDDFEKVHSENWVKPVILMNNEMFSKSMNPDVKHLPEVGMEGLKFFLTIPPKDDNDRFIILEYIERMQPIMKNYKISLENFKKTLDNN
jgi:hypothetical protein